MIIVYIAGPFRGPNTWAVEQNIRRAEQLAARVLLLDPRVWVICPHTNTWHFDGLLPDSQCLAGTIELLRRSDVAVFTADWKRSSGARAEWDEAERLGIPRFVEAGTTDLLELETWIRGNAANGAARQARKATT